MATTAPAITSKSEQATQLRASVQVFTREIQQLEKQLAEKSGVIAQLEEKKRVLAEAAANGKQSKPGAIATIHAEIAEAQAPVEVLQKRLSEKQGALDTAQTALESLDREIVAEARQAAFQARFSELKQELTVSAAVICEKVRSLVEEDLPRFDFARDAMTREIVGGQFAEMTTAEGHEARALIHASMQSWMDGSRLAVTRRLLQEQPEWKERGDIEIIISNLLPPKR